MSDMETAITDAPYWLDRYRHCAGTVTATAVEDDCDCAWDAQVDGDGNVLYRLTERDEDCPVHGQGGIL